MDSLDVLRVGVEDGVDVSGSANDPMANQGDAADQDLANACVVQVFEDLGEAGYRVAAASSIASAQRAIPSASSSSGSRSASSIRR